MVDLLSFYWIKVSQFRFIFVFFNIYIHSLIYTYIYIYKSDYVYIHKNTNIKRYCIYYYIYIYIIQQLVNKCRFLESTLLNYTYPCRNWTFQRFARAA